MADKEIQFVFRVRAPSVSYARERIKSGEIAEGLSAVCQAYCVAPEKFAGRDAILDLTGDGSFIGQIFANKNSIQASVNVPSTSLWHLAAAIENGAVTMLAVFSEPLYRSRGDLLFAAFEGPHDDMAQQYRTECLWPEDVDDRNSPRTSPLKS